MKRPGVGRDENGIIEASPLLYTVVPLTYLPPTAPQLYTYRYDGAADLLPWSLVRISFRDRPQLGLVLPTPAQEYDSRRVKSIDEVLSYRLTPWQQTLGELLQQRYGAVPTLAWKSVVGDVARLPRAVRASRSRVSVKKNSDAGTIERAFSATVNEVVWAGALPDVTRAAIVDYITARLVAGGQVLCLVPDYLSLAAVHAYYCQKFGEEAAVSTSGASRVERSRLWEAVATNQVRVVIGTRSSIFLPFTALTDIVVMDASSDAYKSWDQQPYEDVRQLISSAAPQHNIRRMLVTVTPPLLRNPGKSKLLMNAPTLAPVEIIDRRVMQVEGGRDMPAQMVSALEQLSAKESALILVNRRGFGLLTCRDCDTLLTCADCHRPLVIGDDSLAHCPGEHFAPTEIVACPTCKGTRLHSAGFGIAQAEKILQKNFPNKTIAVIDASRKQSASQKIPQADIVLTTSAIFSRLWLLPRPAVVIAWRAEQLLAAPSWRSIEQALDTLWRLRIVAKEQCLIETNTPDHPLLQAVAKGKYQPILAAEGQERRRFRYPPFVTLSVLTLRAGQDQNESVIEEVVALLKKNGAAVTQARKKNRPALLVRWPAESPPSGLWEQLRLQWIIETDPIDLPQ